ncbi:MAG: hypothetical protein IPK26_07320 [Planctomycetes bacterium]|nr:hypothetical protein [Planctomycetota bacterium]
MDPYKQMAVVVEPAASANSVRYQLNWVNATGNAPVPPETDLFLAELRPGEALLVGLQRYVPLLTGQSRIERAVQFPPYPQESIRPGNTVPVAPANSIADMMSPAHQQETTYFPDTASGVLWIRIVAGIVGPTTATPGVIIQANGLGQAIQVKL